MIGTKGVKGSCDHQVISKRISDDNPYSHVAKDKRNVYARAMCRVIDG